MFAAVVALLAGRRKQSRSSTRKRKRTHEECRPFACMKPVSLASCVCWNANHDWSGIDLNDVTRRGDKDNDLDIVLLDAMIEGFDTGASWLFYEALL